MSNQINKDIAERVFGNCQHDVLIVDESRPDWSMCSHCKIEQDKGSFRWKLMILDYTQPLPFHDLCEKFREWGEWKKFAWWDEIDGGNFDPDAIFADFNNELVPERVEIVHQYIMSKPAEYWEGKRNG